MTIGVAIPTYKDHIQYLDRLLDGLTISTVLPEEVSVSVSEYQYVPYRDYPFKLILSQTNDRRNTAQNTNIALGKLTTDILSVIGGDDISHPQRNEILLRTFENPDIDIVVHNFLQSNVVDWDFIGLWYYHHEVYVNYIDTLFDNIPYPTSAIRHLDFANGFVSFRKAIFDKYQYDESAEAEYIEDSLFNRRLVKDGYKISYIPQKLVLYLKNPNRKP